MSDRLGTAQWEAQSVVSSRYPFAHGKFWLGRSEDATPIGYRDDRHVCLVSGTRGGKGTSIIVNNLCFWPGSAVVVDPKGENASVTAARRGRGSEHCDGMGQAVHVLDPFKAAHVDDAYNSCFNPLADLDPQNEETSDEASRLANAIIVVKDEAPDPYWDEAARSMVKGLILYVLTEPKFTDDERNLITVRKLIQRGAWEIAEAMREQGHDENKIDPPHLLLWRDMEMNDAFDGTVAGIGTQLRSMMVSSPKMFQGVLQGVATQTEFLDSPGMRRVLSKSDFKLSELKTRPEGMTLYLSLPQRYMDTHYRWLRMMVALTTTEMEVTRGQPASGHPVLMVLDEFAGLKRMAAIENAVAQIAGFGVKLFFVLQSLEQLKHAYKDNWETFLSNAGLKIFFSIDDHFTRDYVSKLVGETEIVRELQSSNQSASDNESYAEGRSRGQTFSESTTRGTSESDTEGASYSRAHGTSQTESHSRSSTETIGTNHSVGWSRGSSGGTSYSYGPGGSSSGSSSGTNSSSSGSHGTSHSTSHGVTDGTSFGVNDSETDGRSDSHTTGTTSAYSRGRSDTTGTSETRSQGTSRTAGTGRSESVHRRLLIQPDEVGRNYARIDDRQHPFYPGLALVLITGANPVEVRRAHYYEDPQFIDCFSPHPDHKFTPAIPHTVNGLGRFINALSQCMNYDTQPNGSRSFIGNRHLGISQWLIEAGSVTGPGQAALRIDGVAPDNRSVHVLVPCPGKVTKIAAGNDVFAGDELLTVKTYSVTGATDPFIELRRACSDAMEKLKLNPLPPPPQTIQRPVERPRERVPFSIEFEFWLRKKFDDLWPAAIGTLIVMAVGVLIAYLWDKIHGR